MSDRNRLHRQDPIRGGPIRDFTNLYRRPENDDASKNPQQTPRGEKIEASDANDPLSRGVAMAYRVIDKYLAGGRRAAEQHNSQSYSPRFSGEGLQELVQRMLRYQGELIPLWLQVVGSLVQADGGGLESRNRSSANASVHTQSNEVAIELISKRPVHVWFEPRANCQASELTSAGLHDAEGGNPPLTDLKLVPDKSGRWSKVSITIPENQPVGRYSGVIVERNTGEIRGILSVRIDE